jgi:hypothetical protein
MSASGHEINRWADVRFIEGWKAERRSALSTQKKELSKQRERLEQKWRLEFNPLLVQVSLAAVPVIAPYVSDEYLAARELVAWENEALGAYLKRTEPAGMRKGKSKSHGAGFAVPVLMVKEQDQWIFTPAGRRASPEKTIKAQRMYDAGLDRKAQRELACGILAGETECKSGHRFWVHYRCGNRYCTTCGPAGARRLFAKHADRLLFTATALMLCGRDECEECSAAISEKRLPHWPPPKGHKPRVVCAKLDFTLRNTGKMPAPEQMRELNRYIKQFCRIIERRFKISRKQYGLAYCDELGGNNSNPHAHGVYVGPWLPQSKERKELSRIWEKITGGSFIISIKYAKSFPEALYHAIKYPAKFAERSTPERLATLEIVFHRVRRFHALAAFYNPEVPKEDSPIRNKCPICEERLRPPAVWKTVESLKLTGLRDVELVAAEIAKARGLAAPP